MSENNPFKKKSVGKPEKKRESRYKIRPTDQSKLLRKNAWMNGLSKAELVKIGMCSDRTLDNWIAEWKDARTDALMTLRASQLEINVTPKEINEHNDYILTLRKLKAQHEVELDDLDAISGCLKDILRDLQQHPDFDSVDYKQISNLLRSFVSAKSARSSLQSDYIKCCDTLNENTGIRAYHKAAGNKVNEVAKAQGRLEIARIRKEEGLETSTEKRKGGFFEV